jgi:carbon-monoxide dehydrogenase medium subunit
LSDAAALIGDRQVRNRGTIGGSLAHADPGADYPTVVKALRATITAVGLSGSRNIPADEFFTGIFTTALGPGELVTSVMLPVATGAAYVKHKHPASGYAVAAVAAVVSTDGGTCTDARIVVGGVTGGPVDATAAAAALEGASVSDNAIATASAKVADALAGAIGDSYASAAYRTHLATVLARRALGTAFERAA